MNHRQASSDHSSKSTNRVKATPSLQHQASNSRSGVQNASSNKLSRNISSQKHEIDETHDRDQIKNQSFSPRIPPGQNRKKSSILNQGKESTTAEYEGAYAPRFKLVSDTPTGGNPSRHQNRRGRGERPESRNGHLDIPVLESNQAAPFGILDDVEKRKQSHGLRNSFFAMRLACTTGLIGLLNVTGLLVYHLLGPVEVDGEDGKKKCTNALMFAFFVLHGSVLSQFLGLTSLNLSFAKIFNRKGAEKEDGTRGKIHRTQFLQFCELLAAFLVLFVSGMFCLLIVQLTNGSFSACVEDEVVAGLTFMSIMICILIIVQITFFARFREHIKMLLGVFGESNETKTAKIAYNPTGDWFMSGVKKQVTRDIRNRLYSAVEMDDVEELELAIADAKRKLGNDCFGYMYVSKLRLGLFAISSQNPLHLAAYSGNVTAMKILFEAGFDLNSYDKLARGRFTTTDVFWHVLQYLVKRHSVDAGFRSSLFKSTLLTPLHCATLAGRRKAIQWLLQQGGVDVNAIAVSAQASCRLTPIFLTDHPLIAEELLTAGANHLVIPQPGFKNTVTALQLAYIRGNYALCAVLEDWGSDVALTPLHAAAAMNDTKAVSRLLGSGVNPDCLGEQGYEGFNEKTPLHWASTIGCTEAARILLQYRANPNARDRLGRTPLHYASRNNAYDVVVLLLEAGADANAFDAEEITPIVSVAHSVGASKRILQALVQKGAYINHQLPNGDTALHVAMKNENREAAIAILECGGDVVLVNHDGFRAIDCTTSTELQFAVKKAAGNRDVMISYTHSHMEFAKKIRKSLERAHITTWLDLMDPNGIGGGAIWREEIARGIANASVVLCLLTETYPKSQWCLKELAYAKQVGTPVIAISCENVKITEELQVYLYTRQIIPFESCILSIDKTNPKKVTYSYDEFSYASQLRSLLDGIRDEVEKRRQQHNGFTPIQQQQPLVDEVSGNTAWTTDPIRFKGFGGPFVFLSHGNQHITFVKRLYASIIDHGFNVYLDPTGSNAKVQEDVSRQIQAAKDAIVECSCFLIVLSDKTSGNEIMNDQLAFAEDKGKPIYPILLSEPNLGLGQQYTLSRNEIYHFTADTGFASSLKHLFNGFKEHLSILSQEKTFKTRTRRRVTKKIPGVKSAEIGVDGKEYEHPALKELAESTALGNDLMYRNL